MNSRRDKIGAVAHRLAICITAIGILPGFWLDRYGYHYHRYSPVQDGKLTFQVVAACVFTGLVLLGVGHFLQKWVRVELWIVWAILAWLAWQSLLSGSYRYA